MAPTNNAAFLTAKNTPLKIQPSTYTAPRENELVVKNHAVAINPYDTIIQAAPNLVVSWVKLPFVLGTDVAGEVVEVGPNVTRFNIGDRVVAHAAALDKRVNRACEGGFQEYTVVRTNMTSAIPESVSYEAASVVPLGLSTAACALFMDDYLALPLPTTFPVTTRSGKTLLVWGGSTSVGCNAIQLATAAGYDVVTTASPKNHGYLKTLGAIAVFDYKSASVVSDIVALYDKENRVSAGAMSMGSNSLKPCIDILAAVPGRKFLAQASMDLPPFPKGALDFPAFLAGMLSTVVCEQVKLRTKGVQSKMLNGSDVVANGSIGKGIYEDFLPSALAEGRFVCAPEPQVVGHGLDKVGEAMELSKKGVSLRKLVVTL
ncbi:GroES-like protein [Pleomassaria siparia CBS 279.74]|uniref:GroES-like protein n=1 Tax=Pleomassaria siparia CBS 279.74 TaxID=1314801 RepID=A0A6G1KAT2_9PLEO|nr:GroES-like protein [Pleomassaria siparia CBS 279.74]